MLSSGAVGPLLNVQVQALTAPGVNPVTPTLAGLMTVNGASVANHSVPVETRTRALNTYNVEVQYATSAASTDATKSGLAHFNSSQFSVDANGFVALSGGGEAIDSLGVQATSGSGTNPVLPDGTGKIEIQGALVASGTNPLRSVSTAANTLQLQVQTSQALASTDSTKTGLSNFSSVDFTVDANGFVQAKGGITSPGVRNLGFTYNVGTGTFTVHAQDGSALSATNPAYVTLQSKATPGNLITITITANQDFIDDNGASQIINNLFGLTTGIAVTVNIPFYLYAVTNDAETAISFMISRYPGASISPVNTKIGTPASAIADTQGSFFAFDSVTVTDYDSNPCLMIGSFKMRMSASDDWTVQTLTSFDGIGKFQDGSAFTMPRSQFGAATGKWFKNNGGTAPDSSAGSFVYYIDSTNSSATFRTGLIIDTGGIGAVTALLALPFNRGDGGPTGTGFITTGVAYTLTANYSIPATNGIEFPYVNDAATGVLLNTDFGLGIGASFGGTFIIEFS